MAKLVRVRRLSEQLARETRAFTENKPTSFEARREHNVGDYVVSVRIREPSRTWAVLVGEVVHHFRSTLEHLIWQLILHDGGQPVAGRTGFPIFTERERYESVDRGGGRWMIDGVADRGQALIESLQPFQLADEGLRPETQSFWVLNQLWNIEKHRTLHLCNTLAEVVELRVDPADGLVLRSAWIVDEGAQLEDGMTIARWHVVEGDGTIEVKAKLSTRVALAESGPGITHGTPVVPLVQGACTLLDGTLERSYPLFD
ncbi:MAG: hypothetical protein O3C25_02345 [Chloroflexi bacterium]|nr:hypothetical protein [Chloroflexota bacterium]